MQWRSKNQPSWHEVVAVLLKECKLVANSVNFLIGKREPGNTCEPLEGGLARNQPPQLQWLALVGPQLGKRGLKFNLKEEKTQAKAKTDTETKTKTNAETKTKTNAKTNAKKMQRQMQRQTQR